MDLLQFDTNRKKIVFNALLWSAIWFALIMGSDNFARIEYSAVRALIISTFSTVTVIIYISYLIPQLFFKKKYLAYFIISIILTIIFAFLIEAIITYLTSGEGGRNPERMKEFKSRMSRGKRRTMMLMKFVGLAIPVLLTVLGTTLFEVISFATKKEQEAADLRSQKVETEMKFLKSQINPHFLFNALNNIYSLNVIKSDLAGDNLLKLSGMLRYMLYECNVEKVPLKKEIAYIQNFIDLMLLKDSKGMNVSTEIMENIGEERIAPLLLIPFIENAFKHSKVEDLEKGWINIKLDVINEVLELKVSNSLPEKPHTKDKEGGIGLVNVKKQLALIYPEKHDLIIDEGADEYKVSLKIQLG